MKRHVNSEESTPLPYAYKYKPMDPPPRARLRKKALLKLVLFSTVIGIIFMLGFLNYYSSNTHSLLSYVPYSDTWVQWWKSSGPTGAQEEVGDGEKLAIKDTGKKDAIPLIPVKQPPPSLQTTDKHTTTTTSQPSKSHSGLNLGGILGGFIDPNLLGPIMKTFIYQMGESVIPVVEPILNAVLPPKTVHQLTETLDAVAERRMTLHQAIQNSLIPIAKSSGTLLVKLFPEVANEVFDDCIHFFDTVTYWMESMDSVMLSESFSKGVASYIAPLIDMNETQLGKILENAFESLVPDLSKFDVQNPASFLPNIQTAQNALIQCATQVITAKAQDQIFKSAMSAMTGHGGDSNKGPENKSSSSNPLTNMVGQFFSNYLGGGNEDAEQNDEEPIEPSYTKKSKKKSSNDSTPFADTFANLFGGGSASSNTRKSGKSKKAKAVVAPRTTNEDLAVIPDKEDPEITALKKAGGKTKQSSTMGSIKKQQQFPKQDKKQQKYEPAQEEGSSPRELKYKKQPQIVSSES